MDIHLSWEGEGIDLQGINTNTSKEIVVIDEKYYRPSEVENLLGDASKAEKMLGWKPKVKFKDLVKEMIDYDFKLATAEMNSDTSIRYFSDK